MKTLYKSLYLFVLLMLGLASCGSEATEAPAEEAPTMASDQLAVTDMQFKAAKMELTTMSMQPFRQAIRVNGVLDVPPAGRSLVSAYFGGYVKEINLLPGQKVRKGQLLFVLENPAYIEVQQAFLETKGQLAYLKSDAERQESLAKQEVASQKNALKAAADYQVMQARYESLKKTLAMMQIDAETLKEDNITTTIRVSAPMNGYVTEVMASSGMFLNPADVAVAIMDPEHLHVELSVFEKDLGALALGQAIQFKVQNQEKVYEAKVYLINKVIDTEHRTVGIHGHLLDEKNADALTPGMYVEASIFINEASKLALPQEAVIELDQQYYVLQVQSSNGEGFVFERKLVEVGASSGGYTEIKNHKDFASDAKFVSQGAFNLIAE